MKLNTIFFYSALFISHSLFSQQEYNVYKIDFNILNKSTNKYDNVESKIVNSKAFLSKKIFKVQKRGSVYEIFNITSFSNKETSEKYIYKIKAIWSRENENVIMMYFDKKKERKMVVFSFGFCIIYYLSD